MSSNHEEEEKIQIVAFSTNDTQQTPNDIINIFLEKHNHLILKKSRHAIAFSTEISDGQKSTKIMICSVLDLTREYTGITDVNCYLLFIDLEKEDSYKKIDIILNYAKDYCELSKKLFVIGMISGNDDATKYIGKKDITKILDQAQLDYEYYEVNLSKANEVSSIILNVLLYSQKHSISGENENDKEGGQAGSCSIF